MFDKILIKPDNLLGIHQQINVSSLVDAMLYYGEVHIIASQFEFETLLKAFGNECLVELIKAKRLYIHPCNQHFGVGIHGDYYSVGLFSRNIHNIQGLLYSFYLSFDKDPIKATEFADTFSSHLDIHKFPISINESLHQDISDDDLMTRATKAYIEKYYPEYPDKSSIFLNCEPTSEYDGFYKVNSNLDLECLNSIHRQRGLSYGFNYSGILLGVGETQMDLFTSAELKSELQTTDRYSEIYKVRANKSINLATKSLNSINNFSECFTYGYLSLGEAFESGIISSSRLVSILTDDDSVRFREWTTSLPSNANLCGEFYNNCEDRLSNKPGIKATRLAITTAAGIIPIAGPIIGSVTSALDQFVVDRLIDGWKPKIFIDKVLRAEDLKRAQETG